MGLLSSFIRSLDDLIAQGYPPEVAERIVSGELDPSFEARMARASDRFDIENPEYTGSMELIGDVNTPIWSTQNPSLAATYANPRKGGNITPVFLDREGVSTVRADGTRWNNINDSDRSTNDYMRKAQDYGLPSVAFRDVRDVGPYTARYPRDLLEQAFQPSNTTVTLDPTKIRSINAMFDPEYKGPNILGATAGTAGALGLLAAPEDAEAGVSKTAVQLLRDEANRLRFGDTDNAVDLSYRGSHQAPDADYGAPLYDFTQLIPDDIYGPRGERLYGLGDRAVDAEAFEQLRNARGNPDYETPIYRAVPPGIEDINIGDWVTTSREYARMHGENNLGGDYDIIESTAPAKKLQSEGYPYEFGLLPMRPETVIGGGTALGLLAAPEDASAMESPSLRSALEESGVIGDTLVPTKRPLGERAMGVVDRILTGLEAPQRGLQGLAATGYGLLSGEDFDTAAFRGADVVNQGVEESAREFGDYVFDLTGSPAAATAAYTTGILGSPL